jgi:hypothetical protein
MRLAGVAAFVLAAVGYVAGWGLVFSSPGGLGYDVLPSSLRVQLMFTFGVFGYSMLPVLWVTARKSGELFPWGLMILCTWMAVCFAMYSVW